MRVSAAELEIPVLPHTVQRIGLVVGSHALSRDPDRPSFAFDLNVDDSLSYTLNLSRDAFHHAEVHQAHHIECICSMYSRICHVLCLKSEGQHRSCTGGEAVEARASVAPHPPACSPMTRPSTIYTGRCDDGEISTAVTMMPLTVV